MRRIGLLFPGQGAQSPGMFQELYNAYPVVRDTFDEAEGVLKRGIASLCFEGPAEALNDTRNTQLCILTCEIAAYRLLCESGAKAESIFGFSLGECAALIAAGCIPFAEGLRMVAFRAEAMQRAVPLGQGGMLAVIGQEEQQVRALCESAGDGLWMANFNCPKQIVCSGKSDAVERAVAYAAEHGIAVKKLDVSIPSHCELMRPAADELSAYLSTVEFADAQIPIYCGGSACAETDGSVLKRMIIEQLVSPVRCEACLRAMLDSGVNTVVEAGPGHVLAGFMRKIDKSVARFGMETPTDFEAIAKGAEA